MNQFLHYEELGPDSKEKAIRETSEEYADALVENFNDAVINSILESASEHNIDMDFDSIEFILQDRGANIGINTTSIGHKSLIPLEFNVKKIGVQHQEFPTDTLFITDIEDVIMFDKDVNKDKKEEVINDFTDFIDAIKEIYYKYNNEDIFNEETIEGIIHDTERLFDTRNGYKTESEEEEAIERGEQIQIQREYERTKKEMRKTREDKMKEFVDKHIMIQIQPTLKEKLKEEIIETLNTIVIWKENTDGIEKPFINEYDARLKIRDLIDDKEYYKYNSYVSYEGNGIWSKKKVIKQIKEIKKNGMNKMSKFLYEFSHLNLDTIAHYNREGWISNYPNISDYKKLVENTKPSHWKSDVIEILKEAEKILKIKPIE